jgi:hypothetical protein
VTRGLATEHCSTVSWCRSRASSASSDLRERNMSAAVAVSMTLSMERKRNAKVPGFLADRGSSQDGRRLPPETMVC